VDGATLAGEAHVAGVEVTRLACERRPDPRALAELRRRAGIVFAVPRALPGSIFENVAFGPRRAGVRGTALTERVERALRDAQLWAEVRDRLRLPAARPSGGQQQRLCLARTLALEPEVLLLDEPCSGLDPISTQLIEETLRALAERLTSVLVTNNLAQARRVSDRTAFLFMGALVEEGATAALFAAPRDPRTRDYFTGRFG
jgi:phosphate transport system ATP-binding protein